MSPFIKRFQKMPLTKAKRGEKVFAHFNNDEAGLRGKKCRHPFNDGAGKKKRYYFQKVDFLTF